MKALRYKVCVPNVNIEVGQRVERADGQNERLSADTPSSLESIFQLSSTLCSDLVRETG